MGVPRYWVRDDSLAERGRLSIEWASRRMGVLGKVSERLERLKPLRGERVSACLHITKETAVLSRALVGAGAELKLCASNPLSTQDDVAAALANEGIGVYGLRGMDEQEYYTCIAYALSHGPTITIDDGADLVSTLHKLARREESREADIVRSSLGLSGDAADLIENVVGGTEETTTGVTRLRALARNGLLLYPIVAVNDAQSKSLFDNPIGTGQSALDGLMRATNMLIAGREVVIAGYGRVGSGIAERARGMGARVTVVEVDPIRALRAAMSGFRVATMPEAAKTGDIFITATGNTSVIRREHMEAMKDGALLANAGHFDVEVSKRGLQEASTMKRRINPCVEEFTLRNGRRLYLLAEGRLVNLACAEGHPSEVMDQSFSIQALSIEYIAKNRGKLPSAVLDVPKEIDEEVARLKLEDMGMETEKLTREQEEYLRSWQTGT